MVITFACDIIVLLPNFFFVIDMSWGISILNYFYLKISIVFFKLEVLWKKINEPVI